MRHQDLGFFLGQIASPAAARYLTALFPSTFDVDYDEVAAWPDNVPMENGTELPTDASAATSLAWDSCLHKPDCLSRGGAFYIGHSASQFRHAGTALPLLILPG